MMQDLIVSHVANALPVLLAATDTFWRFLAEEAR